MPLTVMVEAISGFMAFIDISGSVGASVAGPRRDSNLPLAQNGMRNVADIYVGGQ